MEFTQKQIEDMGALFYLNGQTGAVDCKACNKGQVEFEPIGTPSLEGVQVYRLKCESCGRTGRHPN